MPPESRVAILVISDRSSRGERADLTGPALAAAVEAGGWRLAAAPEVLPDELEAVSARLRELADGAAAEVVLTAGGTGLASRDVTPEATLAVAERRVPGLAEAMRAASLAVSPNAMLSRAEAVCRGRALIINLPGSPKAAVECWRVVAPALGHAVELLAGRRPDP